MKKIVCTVRWLVFWCGAIVALAAGLILASVAAVVMGPALIVAMFAMPQRFELPDMSMLKGLGNPPEAR